MIWSKDYLKSDPWEADVDAENVGRRFWLPVEVLGYGGLDGQGQARMQVDLRLGGPITDWGGRNG